MSSEALQLVRTILFRTLIRTQIWVAAAVSALAGYASLGLLDELDLRSLVVVFGSTMLIYGADRFFDAGESGDEALRLASRSAAVAGSLVLAIGLVLSPLRVAMLVALGLPACVAYGIPLWRSRGRSRRLKDVPGLKSWFVGGAVAVASVAVPLAVTDRAVPITESVGLILMLLAATTTNAHAFDIRDFEADRDAGSSSLPVLLGTTGTRVLVTAVAVGAWVCGVLLQDELHAHWGSGVLIAGTLGALWLLGQHDHRDRYAWMVDGLLWLPLLMWPVGG